MYNKVRVKESDRTFSHHKPAKTQRSRARYSHEEKRLRAHTTPFPPNSGPFSLREGPTHDNNARRINILGPFLRTAGTS